MFKPLEEDEALIVEGGVYRETQVYEGPEGGLFVKAKGGYVRVKNNGSTSQGKVKLEKLCREGPLFQDRFGRLCTTPGDRRREVMLTENDQGQVQITVEDPTNIKKIE